MLSFKPTFSLSSFTFIKSHKGGVICISEVIDISPGNSWRLKQNHDCLIAGRGGGGGIDWEIDGAGAWVQIPYSLAPPLPLGFSLMGVNCLFPGFF